MGLTFPLDAQDHTLNADLFPFEELEPLTPLSVNETCETVVKANPMIAFKLIVEFLTHTQQGDTCRLR